IQADRDGLLLRRMGEITDGQYQKYFVESGAYFRQNFFGTDPRLLKMVEHLSDEQLARMRLGGHDPIKVHAAYRAAVDHTGSPTIILAKTIKGYGLGEAGEGKNITHQQKKLNDDELRIFRSRFGIPIPDGELHNAPFYRPADDSAEIKYMQERRKQLGGYIPVRKVRATPLKPVSEAVFEEFYKGTDGREASTTMVFVRMLSKLLRDPEVGKFIVPVVPDEARTFGMEALFRQVGIYSSVGQLYEPVDMDTLLYYKEAKDGQILEEGITEAGSICSFIAAGTAYANHGINTIPFFIYYSMFGFQRIGDFIWAAADMRTRGFLLGGTAGRTTLSGEGLQHQDGNSHILALPVPKLKAQLFGSGAILNEALRAQEILEQKYSVAADVWSVTSYKELYVDAIETERWNRLNPGEKPRVPYVSRCLADSQGVLVAASDYLKTLPNMIAKWMPRRLAALGTDGFGRSEGRTSLRAFFEVDAKFIVLATLHELSADGKIDAKVVDQAIEDLGIVKTKPNPVVA